jgi:hypothetical protein
MKNCGKSQKYRAKNVLKKAKADKTPFSDILSA